MGFIAEVCRYWMPLSFNRFNETPIHCCRGFCSFADCNKTSLVSFSLLKVGLITAFEASQNVICVELGGLHKGIGVRCMWLSFWSLYILPRWTCSWFGFVEFVFSTAPIFRLLFWWCSVYNVFGIQWWRLLCGGCRGKDDTKDGLVKFGILNSRQVAWCQLLECVPCTDFY